MIYASLNTFDAAVIAIIALSCLFAFFRGIVKETLSLGAWVGAGIITIYYFPDVAAWLQPKFKSSIVAAGFATLGLYITCLLGFTLINAVIFRFLKEGSDVGMIDNLFGLMFGAFRGAFIVSLGFLLMTMVMTEEQYPLWVKEARTRSYVEEGAMMLARVSPRYLSDISSLHAKIKARQESSLAGKYGGLTPAAGGNSSGQGYDERDAHHMRSLVDRVEGP